MGSRHPHVAGERGDGVLLGDAELAGEAEPSGGRHRAPVVEQAPGEVEPVEVLVEQRTVLGVFHVESRSCSRWWNSGLCNGARCLSEATSAGGRPIRPIASIASSVAVTTGGAGGPGGLEGATLAGPAVPGPAATRMASPMLLASLAESRRIDERKAP